ARLGRVDPSLLKPIVHRGAQAQRDRILIQTRDRFVRTRTQLVNQVPGFAKALGTRVPPSSTEAFPKRVRATTPMDLFPGLETLLDTISSPRRSGGWTGGWIGHVESGTRSRSCCARFPGWAR